MDKVAQARGIGGEASVCGVVEIPIAVAGVNGIVEATVVEEDVPLLLSIRFLREVHAVVDIADGRLHLNKFGTSTSLHDLPSGHVAVSIVDFPEEGWSAPHEAVVQHRNTRDFELLVCEPAMSGTSFATNIAPVEHLTGRHGPLQATECDEASGGGRRYGVPSKSSQARGAQLDSGAKEGVGADRAVRSTGAGRKLARRWIVLWLASSMLTSTTALGQCVEIHRQCDQCWLQGEGVQGADFGGRPSGSSQVQEPPRVGGQDVLSSCREADGKWQSESARGVVHAMPSEVAGRSPAMMDLAAKKTEVRVGDKVLRAGQSRVETPVAGKNSVKMLRTPTSGGYVRQPDTPLRTQGSMETPPMTPPRLPMRQEEVLCFCGQPAEKLMVKKETARKGRHFYKCLRRVCDFFQWDPKEVRDIQLRESPPAMRQAAEDEVLEIHRQEVQQVIHNTMAEAEKRHTQMMEGQHQVYQSQLEQLHSQLVWMTAVAGEEKLGRIMNDPQLQEEMNRKAQELKQNLEEMEKQAAANSGAGGSNM